MFKREEIDYIDVAKRRLFLAWEGLDKKTKKHIAIQNLIAEFEDFKEQGSGRMSIEQAYRRKKYIIEELKDDGEKCFRQACQYLQKELEEKGYLKWERMKVLLNKATHQVKQLQED